VCKKPTDPLDGAPFIAGTVTLLKQFHSENTERFFALLGQYVRSAIASTHGFVHTVTPTCCVYSCVHDMYTVSKRNYKLDFLIIMSANVDRLS